MKAQMIKALNSTRSGEVRLQGNTLSIDDDNVKMQLDLRFDRTHAHQAIRDWMQVYTEAANNLGFDDFEAVALLVSQLTQKEKEEIQILISYED